MTTLTQEQIRKRIDKFDTFNCDNLPCEECPFFVNNERCGGSTHKFDFASMKLGTETELKDLLKYKRPGNNYEYPNLK